MGADCETAPPRRVMVVADPTRESAAALQYALSHVVVENDELILLHVENLNSWWNTFSFLKWSSLISSIPISMANCSEGYGVGDVNFLEAMRHVCLIAQPKIRVRTDKVRLDGMDKASVILSQSKSLQIDLLIIGQRRNLSLSNAILRYKRLGSAVKGLDTADFLIEKSECDCVGVQKREQNAGYLLNTKTHKNFWLLA